MSNLVGKQVEVYFNLHKMKFSIRCAKSKKVIGHTDYFELRDVTFKVYESGRQRVIRNKCKNVHAFVCGTVVSVDVKLIPENYTFVKYNPYVNDSFVRSNGISIQRCSKLIGSKGKLIKPIVEHIFEAGLLV